MTVINSTVRFMVVLFLSESLIACAVKEVKPLPELDSRIIYRDLLAWTSGYSDATNLVTTPICENKKEQETVLEKKEKTCPIVIVPVEKSSDKEPILQLAFRNESIVIDSDLNMDLHKVNALLNDESHYLVVGYSHGASTKGNSYLASARAEKVSRWLKSKGLSSANIHTFASWSATHESFAPSKGVQVFKVDKNFTLIFS